MNKKPTLLVIAGPTGIGKTTYSIELAQKYNCPIVSADSRQFYKEMHIGTAKPDLEERAQADHYFIDFLSIEDDYTVYDYEKDVIPFLETSFKKHDTVILTGGSGLYIKAVCEGLDPMPKVDPEVRKTLNDTYENSGIESLLEELRVKDPEYYAIVDKNNPRRVIRALEVIRFTGKPFSAMRTNKAATRPFEIKKHCLQAPRDVIYERINRRCDAMIQKGLLEEVKTLYPFRYRPALQTIGYREFFPWIEGKVSLEEATETFKKASRRFAKRQLTWFRNDPDITWISV